MSEVTRPLLRYHGGKWRLAPWIIQHFPEHHVYVEVFGGAASVLLQKDPAPIEIYNDLDQEVVNLFRVLRVPSRAAELRRALELTPFSRIDYEDAYEPADPADVVERARRLCLRMGQSIGNKGRNQRSGWRTRTARNANQSPATTWAGWPEHMPSIIHRLRYTIIEALTWQQIVNLYDDPTTLFYCDPPYPAETRARNHRRMYVHEMTGADHLEMLKRLKECKAMVALSSYPNQMYGPELEGWLPVETKARAQTNAPRTEVLWLNPVAADRTRQGRLEAIA